MIYQHGSDEMQQYRYQIMPVSIKELFFFPSKQ